jgi:hypothetical protein
MPNLREMPVEVKGILEVNSGLVVLKPELSGKQPEKTGKKT